MSDEYGRAEWQTDSDAANAEAARRVEQAIATGAEVLDFADLTAMTRLPEVLAEAQGVRVIYAGGYSPASEFKYYHHPRTLLDIAPLSGLLGLTELNLRGTRITEATALSALERLIALDLSRTRIADVVALASLSSLTHLNLSDTRITDPEALSGLLQLTYLNLGHTRIADAAALSGLVGLTHLDLSSTMITDAAPISGLVRLTSLDLSNTVLSDAAPLSGLVGLMYLNLSGTRITDAEPLSAMVGLTSLYLSDTPISDAAGLASLVALTSLSLSYTRITDAAALSGLVSLNSLALRDTQVSDLGFLLNLREFVAERGKHLEYSSTPAAQNDRRLDLLSRLPPDRCAVETMQYLKGTHPDFREPKGGEGVGRATLAAQLDAASPVELVVEGGRLQARNAGAPERLAPKELGTRIDALRGQVEAVLDEAKGKQMSEDIVKRFRRYAQALKGEEVTYLLLDGPIAALRGGVNDPYITGALDGGFVAMWRALVAMHDDLRPLLLPPEEDDLPELRDDVTAEEGIDLAEKAESALQEALEDGVVGASVVEAMQAATEYFKVAKVEAEKKPLLLRGAIAVGGVLGAIVGLPAMIGAAAEGVMKVQAFLATPAGQALIAVLRPLWEILKGLFV